MSTLRLGALVVVLALVVGAAVAFAQTPAPPAAGTPVETAPAGPAAAAPADPLKDLVAKVSEAKVAMDTMWVILTAFLVFFMNLGFATVESGFCRAKNTVTIMAKNFVVFAVASIAFLVLGFGLMFGDGNPLVGTQGLLFVTGADNSPAMGDAYKGAMPAASAPRLGAPMAERAR